MILGSGVQVFRGSKGSGAMFRENSGGGVGAGGMV